MDPEEALKQLRDIVARRGGDDAHGTLDEVCELFDGLDQWLSHGGYLPSPWASNHD